MLRRRIGVASSTFLDQGLVSLNSNPAGRFSLTRFEIKLEIAAPIARQRAAVLLPRDPD
jgi:hypothetical protein